MIAWKCGVLWQLPFSEHWIEPHMFSRSISFSRSATELSSRHETKSQPNVIEFGWVRGAHKKKTHVFYWYLFAFVLWCDDERTTYVLIQGRWFVLVLVHILDVCVSKFLMNKMCLSFFFLGKTRSHWRCWLWKSFFFFTFILSVSARSHLPRIYSFE